jgi:excisionase family DNA binding protein
MAEKYLRVKDVAKEIGCAEITVRTWMAARKLGFVRLGRSVRDLPPIVSPRIMRLSPVFVRPTGLA